MLVVAGVRVNGRCVVHLGVLLGPVVCRSEKKTFKYFIVFMDALLELLRGSMDSLKLS